MNANAEMTVRKKLNAAKARAKKKEEQETTMKKPAAKAKAKAKATSQNSQKKMESTKEEKEDESGRKSSSSKGGKDTKEKAKTEKKEAPSSKTSADDDVPKSSSASFSLQHAQKQSKKQQPNHGLKRPAAAVQEGASTPESEAPPKRIRSKTAVNLEGKKMKKSATTVMDPEERKRQRNRCTSHAYHKVYDQHRPKKSQGIEDPATWARMTEEAKALARSAHREAGLQFDKEHPRMKEKKPKEDGKKTEEKGSKTVVEKEEQLCGEEEGEEEDREEDPCIKPVRDVD